MKERIVIDYEDILFSCLHDYEDNVGVINYKLDRKKVEKYPTSWEELKTMCEELEGKTMDVTCEIMKDEIDVTIWNIDRSYKVGFAEFYYSGDTVYLGMGTGFSIPIEIPKVWSFIKSLIGEE